MTIILRTQREQERIGGPSPHRQLARRWLCRSGQRDRDWPHL